MGQIMTKDEIRARLDAAGVEYDARWGAERLKALLPRQSERATFTVIAPSFWLNGRRHPKGARLTLPADYSAPGVKREDF